MHELGLFRKKQLVGVGDWLLALGELGSFC